MRIFGWAADQGGCGYYRMGLPLAELSRNGHDVQVSIALTGYEKTADVVVGQRLCNPGASRHWREWAALPTGHRPVLVLELDDDLWRIDAQNQGPHRYYTRERLDALRTNIALSDLVTVSTEPLKAQVLEEVPDARVVVLGNVVDETLLGLPRRRPPVGAGVVFGWAGSFNHGKDWPELEGRLKRFLSRNPGASFHTIGGDHFVGHERVRYTGWSESVTDYYYKVDFDVGVIPLAPSVFNRSKSYIKALEYAALNIPTVASDSGPYPDFIAHGETGYLVTHPHEWDTYLGRLLRDPAERAKMGALAHKRAEAYTIQGNWTRWERAYEDAAQ